MRRMLEKPEMVGVKLLGVPRSIAMEVGRTMHRLCLAETDQDFGTRKARRAPRFV
jgi:hypothetical protein